MPARSYGTGCIWFAIRTQEKRISRANPREEWKTAKAPDLAIVSADIFEAAQKRKAQRSHDRANGRSMKKPKRLLSGLLRCGSCGSGIVSAGKKNGHLRLRCSRYSESGTCENGRSYRTARIEAAVVNGILDLISNPAATEEFISQFLKDQRSTIDEATRGAAKIEQRLAKATAEQDRLIRLYSEGTLPFERVEQRLKELQSERDELLSMASVARRAGPGVELHPAAVREFHKTISRIKASVENEEDIMSPELIDGMRKTVSHIVISNLPDGGYEAEVITFLSAFTGSDAFNGVGRDDGGGEAGTGSRYHFSS